MDLPVLIEVRAASRAGANADRGRHRQAVSIVNRNEKALNLEYLGCGYHQRVSKNSF